MQLATYDRNTHFVRYFHVAMADSIFESFTRAKFSIYRVCPTSLTKPCTILKSCSIGAARNPQAPRGIPDKISLEENDNVYVGQLLCSSEVFEAAAAICNDVLGHSFGAFDRTMG